MAENEQEQGSAFWRKPKKRWQLGIPLGGFIAFGLGAIALGSMNWVLHETSSTEFCFACHSHDAFIRGEYEASSHFRNASGVSAGCSDCHLPHDSWFGLVWTKAVVSLDIFPELAGKLDTAEKYESHRAEMAESVWREFKANDSAYCRSCHSFDSMDVESQDRRTARQHTRAADSGQTCIECHYGLVHELPENAEAILEEIAADFAARN